MRVRVILLGVLAAGLLAGQSGNPIITPFTSYIYVPAALCTADATAIASVHLPTSNAPAAACVSGTNTQVASLDFDTATDESIEFEMMLPPGFAGAVDMDVGWRATATSGTVMWSTRHSCVADGEAIDAAFGTATPFGADTVEGTADFINISNDADILSAVTCDADDVWRMEIIRDVSGDTLSGDARMEFFRITVRNE